MASYSLTPQIEADVHALVRAGLYANQSEVLRDAIRHRIDTLAPEKRLRAAIELYRMDEATVSRAAELAGLPFDQMRRILQQEGVLRFAGDADTPARIQEKSRRLLGRTGKQ